ncbi:MAG TPA: glycoside hydrolase family 2 protein [Mycobacteriales bacterium]|nr:glycoside hydrolase family 2 protein [Mycobacteriales bacterium]
MTTQRITITAGHYLDADPAQQLPDDGWAAISLPVDVHRQLVADGRIADPDHGDANHACTWVQERAWWFRFALPDLDAGPGADLAVVLDRVDTQATVWLDDVLLGSHASAFRPATFALPARLDGASLIVRIDPPARDDNGEYDAARDRLRKPAYGYGWDFAPVRPSIGLGSVTVVRRDRAAIDYVDVRTMSVADPARLTVRVDCSRTADAATRIRLLLTDPDGSPVTTAEGTDGAVIPLEVPAPRLWWTADRGEPNRYTLTTQLLADGEVVDTDVRKIGIRTIALDRSADPTGGEYFRFVLNDEPVASLGANWVPCGMSTAAPDDARSVTFLTLARDAGMSMLRIWGGGYYETDAFYDACDRLGLLIWHDFMFANREYPQDDAYLAEIEAEARHQVRRLVSHPCMALWCGNNEIEAIAAIYDWPEPRVSPKVFYDVLPQAVATYSDLPYVGSSPCEFNAHDKGDRHNWQVWHGVDANPEPATRASMEWYPTATWPALDDPGTKAYVAVAHPRRYLDDVTRFASEYGLCSYSHFETLQKWLDPQALQINHPQLLERSRPGRFGPYNKVEIFLDATVGIPDNLPDYVRATQLMQAEGIKLGTEHFRRLWPICSGELLWQLHDCWPSISWSLVDTELRPKPAWYYTRRFYAPMLASVKPVDGGVELWLTNNGHDAFAETFEVRTTTFRGDLLWAAEVSGRAEPGESAAVAGWSLAEIQASPSAYLTATSATTANRHFFTDVVEMDRAVPTLDVRQARDGDRLDVTVSADALALMVTVRAGEASFDDNYFDLHAGQPRTVTAYGVAADVAVEVFAS